MDLDLQNSIRPGLDILANEIIIARLLANALDQAEGPLTAIKEETNS